MCGIFGYKGSNHKVLHTLVHGLERLEYRGYDSAGVVGFAHGQATMYKTTGRVEKLSELIRKDAEKETYVSGIAHTRWATHGGVTEENCHPHKSNSGEFYVVHNGIIENYRKLKTELQEEGYTFQSETDTEVISNLLQKHWTGDLIETVQIVTKRIRGAYALLIVHRDNPNHLVGVRLGSPLLFGYTGKNYFFSSDSQAMAGYAEKIIYLEDGDILSLEGEKFLILSGGVPTRRDVEELDQEQLEASKGSYKHFMLKEMFEQPAIVKRIFLGRIDFDKTSLKADGFEGLDRTTINDARFIACGTSYYSSLLGAQRFQNIPGIPSQAIIASEAENTPSFLKDDSLRVFVSQSGETADTIEVLKQIIDEGGKTFGVVNVPGSTIARLTDSGLFTRAGTEIGVASTKAFVGQSVCMLMLSIYLGKMKGMRRSHYKQIIHELENLPMYIETVLDQSEYIRSIAQQLVDSKGFFFLGRGYHVPIAYESALKLKEISYAFAQGYPAGELKHGALALIEEKTPSIFFMPHDEQFEKNVSSMHEIQAREGKVLVISDKKVLGADRQITIPSTISEVAPIVSVVAGQLLAYHIADIMGRDIDKPRNLAKSVTVK